MKALVTGATGFLGKRLAMRLNQLDWDVIATGRNMHEGAYLEERGIPFYNADLWDQNKITALCKGREIIFHCAALSSPWGSYHSFYQTNVIGTKNVIKGAKEQGVHRLIYVSTPSIYFDFQDRLHISENDPLPTKKANAYAETKWMAEKEIDRAWQQGLPTLTIRPRALFGPGDHTILPRILRANQQGAFPLINEGKTRTDITYVENVVDALLLCSKSGPDTFGKKYNITNGDPLYLGDFLNQLLDRLNEVKRFRHMSYAKAYTLATLMEWIARFSKREPLLTRYTVGVLGKNQTLNIQAAQNELGYVPRIGITEGINEFATWWECESCAQ